MTSLPAPITTAPRRRSPNVVARMLVPWLTTAIIACGGNAKEDARELAKERGQAGVNAPKEPAQVTADVDTVREAAFTETIDAVGSVVARVGHIALLSAPAPTRVTRVFVAVGDRVKKDAEVIEFEHPGFDAASASAEAALTLAERAVERAERLVAAGVSPRKDAEVATAELATARMNAVNARRTRELSHLRSPIAGAVTRVNTVLGASVDAGQPLIEIVDPSTLDVVLHVASSNADHLRSGTTVQFYDGAGTQAAVVARGQVVDIGATVDSATRGVAVRVSVTASTRTLRLGESLSGRMVIAVHAKALSVPDVALVPAGEGFRVFVIDSADVAHAHDVKIGGRAGGRVWITEGIAVGDVVVTTGAYGIDDGARVLKAETRATSPAAARGKP